MTTNQARKQRLLDIARDRLAYSEYQESKESLERQITGLYQKLQRKDMPKPSKKKKKSGGSGTNGNGGDGGGGKDSVPITSLQWASLGLGPDADAKLVVPEGLKKLVMLRQKWVDVVGGAMDKKEKESPGLLYGLPQKSVYEGLELPKEPRRKG